MEADGSGQTRLTNNAAPDQLSVWSPDGSKIAFQTRRDDGTLVNAEIYVMNADGSNPINLTNDPAATDQQPAWSP